MRIFPLVVADAGRDSLGVLHALVEDGVDDTAGVCPQSEEFANDWAAEFVCEEELDETVVWIGDVSVECEGVGVVDVDLLHKQTKLSPCSRFWLLMMPAVKFPMSRPVKVLTPYVFPPTSSNEG